MTGSRSGDSRDDALARGARRLSSLWKDDDDEDEAVMRAELSEPDTEDYGLITDYLAGELSPADRERYEHRLRTDAEFRDLAKGLETIWNLPGRLAPEPDEADRVVAERTVAEFWRRRDLERRGIHTPTLAEKRATLRKWRGRVFGGVIGFLAVFFNWWVRPQLFPAPGFDVRVDATATADSSATLPDRTHVTLAPDSHLRLRPWFRDADQHTLTLDGEGTFTVTPGSRWPLVVRGPNVEVTSFAGRFTIQAYHAMPFAYVKVEEGQAKVGPSSVLFGDEQTLTLQAGEAVRVGPGMAITLVDAPIVSHREVRK